MSLNQIQEEISVAFSQPYQLNDFYNFERSNLEIYQKISRLFEKPNQPNVKHFFPYDVDSLCRLIQEIIRRNKPMNLLVILDDLELLTPLIDGFAELKMLDQLDLSYEIDRHEIYLDDYEITSEINDYRNTICKVYNTSIEREADFTYYDSFIPCEKVCPIISQFPEKSTGVLNQTQNCNDVYDIEDLFSGKHVCPILEFERHNEVNQSQNQSEKNIRKVRLLISTNVSIYYYILKQSMINGCDIDSILNTWNIIVFGNDPDPFLISNLFPISFCYETVNEVLTQIVQSCKYDKIFCEILYKIQQWLHNYFIHHIPITNSLKSILCFNEQLFTSVLRNLENEKQYLIEKVLIFLVALKSPIHFNIDVNQIIKKNNYEIDFNCSISLSNNLQSLFLDHSILHLYEWNRECESSYFYSFLSLLCSKENNYILFLSSTNIDDKEPNQFGKNVIRMDYNQQMVGVRILKWYPSFFAKIKNYLLSRDCSRCFHLTGSPGIGKTTFLFYLVLRWVKSSDNELLCLFRKYNGFKQLNAISISFVPRKQGNSEFEMLYPENILIFRLEGLIHIGEYSERISIVTVNGLTKIKIIFTQLYQIENNEPKFLSINDISSNFYKSNGFNIIRCDENESIKWIINDEKFICLKIFDGCPSPKSGEQKFILSSSYNHSILSSHYDIPIVAPACTPYEFQSTILLCRGGHKRKMLENARIISKYINFNIRDALILAKTHRTSMLEDDLLLKMIRQLRSNDIMKVSQLSELIDKQNYLFFMTPYPNNLFISPSRNYDSLLNFTSDIAKELVLGFLDKNNVDNKSLLTQVFALFRNQHTGYLFEGLGNLNLQKPCLLNCVKVSSAFNQKLHENVLVYESNFFNFNLFINACTEVVVTKNVSPQQFIDNLFNIPNFADKNYLYIPNSAYQSFYDSLLFDSQNGILYGFQMRVDKNNNFNNSDLDALFTCIQHNIQNNNQNNAKNINSIINKVIYIHLRNHLPINRIFLDPNGRNQALLALNRYHNFEIYYARLDLTNIEIIRRYCDDSIIQHQNDPKLLEYKNRFQPLCPPLINKNSITTNYTIKHSC